MVLKLLPPHQSPEVVFENDVKMYGTQTFVTSDAFNPQFENDVKMYGTQTFISKLNDRGMFENDVKMYGTQTFRSKSVRN